MVRMESVAIYPYDELGPKGQEKARAWFKEGLNLFSSDSVSELFSMELETLGLGDSFKTYWSLSYSQGDGVAFEGTIYLDDYLKFHDISKDFKLFKGQGGEVYIKVELQGRYTHKNSMRVDASFSGDFDDDEKYDEVDEELEALEQVVLERLQDLSGEFEKIGYDELECRYSDEVIAEDIIANEYEFTEDGAVWG